MMGKEKTERTSCVSVRPRRVEAWSWDRDEGEMSRAVRLP